MKMCFDTRWINLMMECVASVRYKVFFKSHETDKCTPTRGLRQGDPLSSMPYLFLICSEGLSSLSSHAAEEGTLLGVKAFHDAP
jgi:hypothetical protein